MELVFKHATRETGDNLDSLAIWRNKLIATSKAQHNLRIYSTTLPMDPVRDVALTRLSRPNGICVVRDDEIHVVQRDAHRVIVMEPSGGKSLLARTRKYGQDILVRPYGISAYIADSGKLMTYVTETRGPHRGVVLFEDYVYKATYGADVLSSKLESVCVDPAHGRVYVADEGEKVVCVFSLDFRTLYYKISQFEGDPEGIALYKSYVFCTDQKEEQTVFRVFRRSAESTPALVATLTSPHVKNTDGITITGDTLYAVDDDTRVVALTIKNQ